VPTDAEVDATLRRIASTIPDLPDRLVVVVVNADGEEDAWARVAAARHGGPSNLSEALASSFADAHPSEDAYVLGGPYAQLNERVLVDALRIAPTRGLRGVTAIFVSPADASAELRKQARGLGLLLRYRAYPVQAPEGG
jgi:hypothetical protein